MSKITSAQQVNELLRAKYPLIYVASSEEGRVLEDLTLQAKELKRSLIVWSITKGFEVLHKANAAGDHKLKVNQPGEALAHLESSKGDLIAVLLDFGPFTDKDPVIVRALRDTVEAFRNGENVRNLIMLGTSAKIPADLDKIAQVVDWDLPTRAEAALVAEEFRAAYSLPAVPAEAIDALTGLTKAEIENAISKSLVRTRKIDAGVILEEKRQIIRKSGILEYIETDLAGQDVGGLGNLKTWLGNRKGAFSDAARAFKLPRPKGIVLVGVPGSGKTLIAKTIGNEWSMPLLKFDMGRIFGGLVGSSEENMRRTIKIFEAVAPCVILLDEGEKQLAGSASSGQTDGGTTSRVFGTFLSWLNDQECGCFVVMTANAVEQLPPELLRKGRMDEIWFVDLPDLGERLEIMRIQIAKVGRDPATLLTDDQDRDLARLTDGFSGAEIEQVVKAALYLAFAQGEELAPLHLIVAAKEVVPLSKTAAEKIEYLRDWARGKAQRASIEREPVTSSQHRRFGLS